MAGVCAGVKRAAAAAGESVVRVLQLPELVPWAGAAQMQRKLVDVHREDKQVCSNKMTFVEGGGGGGGVFLFCGVLGGCGTSYFGLGLLCAHFLVFGLCASVCVAVPL